MVGLWWVRGRSCIHEWNREQWVNCYVNGWEYGSIDAFCESLDESSGGFCELLCESLSATDNHTQ